MKKINLFKKFAIYSLIVSGLVLSSCGDDDDVVPEPEEEQEIITDVKLTFTNDADASDVVTATAKDPDGEGALELEVVDAISLDTSKTYTLTFEIMNNLETPGEDIGAEIAEEDDEHQLFYSFSDNAFTNPAGNGNIDNAADAINYLDKDGNGNAVGLTTRWTTSSTVLSGGKFKVMLQHQPGIKTAATGATDGDTDFAIQFVLNIQIP